jgi:nucleoid DNA-binding protein
MNLTEIYEYIAYETGQPIDLIRQFHQKYKEAILLGLKRDSRVVIRGVGIWHYYRKSYWDDKNKVIKTRVSVRFSVSKAFRNKAVD